MAPFLARAAAGAAGGDPLTQAVVQVRSILELFTANFVGAPRPPGRDLLLQIASSVVTDQLLVLGVPTPVALALGGKQLLAPMLGRALGMFLLD